MIVFALMTPRALRILSWTFVALHAGAVGFSRVYRGDHYVADVVAGALLGVVSVWSAVFIIRVVRTNPGTQMSAPNAEQGQVAGPVEGASP